MQTALTMAETESMPPSLTQNSESEMTSKKSVAIHWFRHGLRLHDNPALLEAIKCCKEVYPIFIFDGEVAGTKSTGYNRMRFLLESLQDLDESLKKHGGRLFCFTGSPVNILGHLFKEWGVSMLTFEQDPEPVWQSRDDLVKSLCAQEDVQCVEKISHTLWDPKEIIDNNAGKPPLTYMLFNQVATAVGDPPQPTDDPDFTGIQFKVSPNHDSLYGVPASEKLGIFPECAEQNKRVNNWIGGETRALKLFDHRLKVEEMAFTCGTVMPNQSYPDIVGPPLSMSAYLRFGCLSIRKLYWALRNAYAKINPNKPYNISVLGQLIWREYFYTMSVNNINYNKMVENPICLNIPWYENKEHLDKWKNGETGYPWIDAIMKQLVQEGWIHHVARHAVSTFLTRGDLWLSWEEGLKVFDKYLLDADWSVCSGNWMWMSSSAFEKVLQCPKCFCPVRYGRKMDPQGIYIKRYLPVLKDMPLRYLFEPWKAPKAVQENAKCIVGVDYPKPMVEHAKVSKECYNMMMEVKNRLLASNEGDIRHCGPANSDEVCQFIWMPGNHKGSCDKNEADVNADAICDGLLGL